MMTDRVGLFDESDFDIEGFAPKKAEQKSQVTPDAVRAVSEAADFRSREPAPSKKQKPSAREPRRHRTGRNVQLNIKVRSETLDTFYEIADRENWVLGETLEKAIVALGRELAAKPISKA
jgi:hypothetical protein